MSTATAGTFAAPDRATHRRLSLTQLRSPLRFARALLQRRANQRMLRIVQNLDHPGVLADFESARGSDWQ